VTWYTLDGRDTIPGRSKKCSLLHSTQTDSGVHPASYKIDTENSFPEGIRVAVWSWPPYFVPRSSIVKLSPLPPYAFMAWRLINWAHRFFCIFYLTVQRLKNRYWATWHMRCLVLKAYPVRISVWTYTILIEIIRYLFGLPRQMRRYYHQIGHDCSMSFSVLNFILSLDTTARSVLWVFSFLWWDKTGSTWYCGHYWPIVPAPDDRWWVWSSRWNEDWQGKLKYSEETCPSATLSTKNPKWPDLGSNPDPRGGKPTANRLSYGAAM
jgi:hypothetical protein